MNSPWEIVRVTSEDSWTKDYLDEILEKPCLPATRVKIGSVNVVWEEIDPRVAFVRSSGGTPDDRYIAEQIVTSRLTQHGYDRAQFSLIRDHKTADWDDIEAKAKRLIDSGNVTLLRNGPNNIVAYVVGDHGEYNCEIGRDDPNSWAITTWQCECPWDQFAWQRTRQWKKYEGRPCAHVLAAYWLAKSTPLDEELAPGQVAPPGQRGFQPQTPADIVGLPGQQLQLPFQQEAPVQMPPAAPAAPSVLPPFPGEQMQMVPPGQLPPGAPGITVSEPGARQPTPFNPMQNPSTYSKVSDWVFESADFNNSDMVRINDDEWGIAEGKSEAHGAGSPKLIPKGSVGEVLGQDPTTGWVDVIFAGPQANAGPMEPYHIRAIVEPGMLTPMPNVAKPGPFIKRRQ